MLLIASVALLAGRARADGLSATLEPGYRHVETDVTRQDGDTTHESEDLLTQRYRLSLDRSLTSTIGASAGGTFQDDRGWKRTDGAWSDEHGRTTSLFGRLTLGTPQLNAGLGADRSDQRAHASWGNPSTTENYTGYVSWRPLELPELDLRLGRTNLFDDERRLRDSTTDSASFSVRYHADTWDLRYVLGWSRANDHLQSVRTTATEQTVLGTRTDSFLDRRVSTYVSGTVHTRNTLTEASGDGGTVSRQQLPVAGLSAVEAAPATPEDVALAVNPLVIDGNLTAGASVDVGFGRTILGDTDARDVGVRFGDLTTAVNTLYLWVDRTLPTEVATALAAGVQVYESNDDQTWTQLALATPATPSSFENRLEITIAETKARYLKVLLHPLAAGVTTDSAYREILITELQTFLVLPASSVPRRESDVVTSATGFARTLLVRSIELAHDVSATVTHDSDASTTRYSVVNGISAAHRIWADIRGNARAARQDQDEGLGHEGAWQWSAALTGKPLPTAYWTLTYSGSSTDDEDGTILAHAVSALGRAALYDGIDAQVSAGASKTSQGERDGNSGQAAATVSLRPNGWLTLTTGGFVSRSVNYTPSTGDVVAEYGRVDGSFSFTPAPALSAAGTVSRIVWGATPSTLGTLQLNWFPLRGELQLALAFSNTLDTAADSTTRLFTPSLRWNVRPGVAWTTSYTWLRSDAPAQLLSSRSLVTTLLITL